MSNDMPRIHLSDEALLYKGQWVSFTRDFKHVVGHGLTPKDAQDMAKATGDDFTFLFFMPERWPDALQF